MDEQLPREHVLGRRRLALAVALLACALALAAGLARRLELVVPGWVAWHEASIACDLDGDGMPEEVALSRRRARVRDAAGAELVATDRAWRVSDVLVADVDADGAPELALLVWRRGNYGSSRPFWETGPDLRMTQHLYVMRLDQGSLRPVWMSHELGPAMQVVRMEAPEPGCIALTTRQGERSVWDWDYFGFSLRE